MATDDTSAPMAPASTTVPATTTLAPISTHPSNPLTASSSAPILPLMSTTPSSLPVSATIDSPMPRLPFSFIPPLDPAASYYGLPPYSSHPTYPPPSLFPLHSSAPSPTPFHSPHIDSTSPYFLSNSNQPGLSLVTDLLRGDNYPNWSCAVVMSLGAKNKLGFIDGSISRPVADSPLFAFWFRCNSMVKAWIVHSLTSSVGNSIMSLDSARHIWLDLHERFSKKNAPRLYELRCARSSHPQGDSTISDYFTALKVYWDEYSAYCLLPPCTCGSLRVLSEREDLERLMDFLRGLSDFYSAVRSQILSMDPPPPVNRAYNLPLQEECQRSINSIQPALSSPAAMAAQRPPSRPPPRPDTKKDKSTITCSTCGRPGHPTAQCFKTMGYPDWWQPRATMDKPRPLADRPPTTARANMAAFADDFVTSHPLAHMAGKISS